MDVSKEFIIKPSIESTELLGDGGCGGCGGCGGSGICTPFASDAASLAATRPSLLPDALLPVAALRRGCTVATNATAS